MGKEIGSVLTVKLPLEVKATALALSDLGVKVLPNAWQGQQ